jgi:hypothetical protein
VPVRRLILLLLLFIDIRGPLISARVCCCLSRLEGESQHKILFTTVAFMMVVVVRIVRRLVSSSSIEEMRHSSSRQVRLTDENSFAKRGLSFR